MFQASTTNLIMTNEPNKHNYSVDFLRFLLVMAICYVHQMHQELAVYSPIYIDAKSHLLGLGVECFFIMSGFFLFFEKQLSIYSYACSRFIRLWPLLALSICIPAFIFGIEKEDVYTLLFLQGTGISQGCRLNGVAWYVCVLFWCSLFYFGVKKIPYKQLQLFFVGIVVAASFAMLWGGSKGDLIYSDPRGFSPKGGISIMLLRGIFAMGVGFLFGLMQAGERWGYNNKRSMTFFEISILAVFLLFYFRAFGYFSLKISYCVVMAFFSMLFLLFYNNAGYISSRLLNLKIFNLLGKYSYAIYITQNCMFFVSKQLAANSEMLYIIQNYPKTTKIIFMLLYIVNGIVFYYIAQQCIKFVRLCKKWEV